MRSLKILAVAAVATGAVAVPGLAAQAATLHPTKEFVTPVVTVTTTTGQKVHFAVDMYHDSYDTTIDVDLSNMNRRGFGEDHDWTFEVKPSVLTYSKNKGALVTGTEFGPYGKVTLSFSKYSQATRSCRNDNNVATKVTTIKAKVKGVVAFIARSSATQYSKLGAVRKGTSRSQYHFGYAYAHYITTTNGECRGSTPPPPAGAPDCFSATAWQGPMVGSTSLRLEDGGSGTGTPTYIEGMNFASLSSPAGTTRMDDVIAPAPDPVLDKTTGNGVLTVTTTPGTAASGSATLTATAPATTGAGVTCNDSSTGTTKTETETDYGSADFANGSTRLSVMSLVGGAISLRNAAGEAAFQVYSFA